MVALTAAAAIESAKTIIIKIGSSLLVEESSNRVNADWIAGMERATWEATGLIRARLDVQCALDECCLAVDAP